MEYTATGPDGNDYTITGPAGASDEEVIAQIQKAIAPSAMESAGRAAVNNLPLGGQLGALGTSAVKNEDYSKGMADWNQKAAEAKAAHPIAYGAGAVGGTLAPLAIPGVGEAMAAAPATTGAALGAANAVGNTDLAQNPGEAAKQALEGGVTGAVLGKLMPSGTKTAEEMEGYANRKTVEAMGLPPGLLNKPREEIEELGQKFHDLGLDTGSMDDKVNLARAKLKEVGDQIGAKGLNAAPLQDVAPHVDKLNKLMQDSAEIYEPGANQEVGIYRQAIANLQQPDINFQRLQQLKTSVGDRAFDAVGNVKNDALANVYGVYKDAMKSIVDNSGEYQDMMDQYKDLLDINGALGKARGYQNANGVQAKGFGMVGKLGGMVTGGNVPLTVGLAGTLAPAHPFMAAGALTTLVNNPQVMGNMARTAGEALPGIAKAATVGAIGGVASQFNDLVSNPKIYGKFSAPLLQAAQTGGKDGFAATSFVLRQQHPELNDIMMRRKNEAPNE